MSSILEPAPGFSFLRAELGDSDVSEYIAGLPPVDVLYCAPPNPRWMRWWRKAAGADGSGDYHRFILAWLDLVIRVDARECHLDLGTCRPLVEAALDEHWPGKSEQPARYAAPSTSRGTGMCRTRTSEFTRLSYWRGDAQIPIAESSDAFLSARLRMLPPSVCFDPCIGKGLLSRMAVDNGHRCHGIDINIERLRAAAAYIEAHYGD